MVFIFSRLGAVATALGLFACGVEVVEPIGGAPEAASGAAGSAPAGDLTRDLIAYWKLDELGASEAALDSASGSSPGTPVNAPGPSAPGPSLGSTNLGSRAFDGQSQYLLIANSAELDFSGEITLAAWVNLAAVTDGCQYIVAHGYCWEPPGEVALRVASETCGPGGAPHYWAAGSWLSAEHSAVAPIYDLDLGSWVHLVGTYDGQAWHLYRNGQEVATEVSDVGAVPVQSDWAIGARAPGAPPCVPEPAERFFNGNIDDVRIYRRALDAAEVEELYDR